MNKNTNCPNCGAPITSNQCEYCGTVFSNFSDDTVQKVGLLRSKIEMLRQEFLRESLYTAALTAIRRRKMCRDSLQTISGRLCKDANRRRRDGGWNGCEKAEEREE